MRPDLKYKIGQMIIAGFPSPELDEQARKLVEDYQVGNFALFARNVVSTPQLCKLCGDLHRLAYEKNGIAALIACDMEGGSVSRVSLGATRFAGPMAMAASASADPYAVGYDCAKALGSVGISGVFGPVLDVNTEPMNPIIGTRSYSDDAGIVSRLGTAMVRGLQDGGVMASVKHYPGHGSVTSDSHLGIPVNDSPEEVLQRVEFPPFQKAFEEGSDALMTCHVLFRNYDPEVPATLSRKIMTGLLREQMHFQGVAITDCLEMDAIKEEYGLGRGAVLAVQAGCDLLCFSHTYEAVKEAAEALYEAVENGTVSEERIEESYRRIRKLKEKYGLLTPPVRDAEQARERMYDARAIERNAKISRDSMTLLTDEESFRIFREAEHPRFFAPPSIALHGAEDKERKPTYFSELAARRFGGDSVVLPLNELDEATAKAIEEDSYDVAVLALYNARFRPGQRAVIRKLEEQKKPLVVLLLGAPYDAPLLKRADCVIAAYEYTAQSAEALLDVLEEGVFRGKRPVELRPLNL